METNTPEIYMDYQAAKPVDPQVIQAMTKYYEEEYDGSKGQSVNIIP